MILFGIIGVVIGAAAYWAVQKYVVPHINVK